MLEWSYPIGNNGLGYNLHPGQVRAWLCEKRFILVLAGTQGGKTTFGPLWLHREIQRRGAGDYLAASSTFDLFDLKMLPEMLGLFRDKLGYRYLTQKRMFVDSTNKIRVILRSAQSPGGLESATAKAAWLDEWGQPKVKLEHWEAVQRRLTRHVGRCLLTTTPYTENWLRFSFYDLWKGGDPDYAVVSFRSIDNPAFPKQEYERARRTLPRWRFKLFYDGVFTRPAGLIYEDFYESRDVIPDFVIPKDWIRLVGIDFGLENTAKEFGALTPEPIPTLIVYRDILEGRKTAQEHAKSIMDYKEIYQYVSGGSKSEQEIRDQYGYAGLPVVEPLISGVEAGIDHVITLIKQNRLKVFRSCMGIRSELGTYSREVDEATGNPTEKIADKKEFHRLDGLRYLCSYIDTNAFAKPTPIDLRTPRQRALANIRRGSDEKVMYDDNY